MPGEIVLEPDAPGDPMSRLLAEQERRRQIAEIYDKTRHLSVEPKDVLSGFVVFNAAFVVGISRFGGVSSCFCR